MPPTERVLGSGRARVPEGLAAGAADEEFDAVRTGEICAMAEPGLAGRFLVVRFALFCAIKVSRRLGLLDDMVLLERPRPGRGASLFFGELGLLGSLLRSFCAVESRSAMILFKVSVVSQCSYATGRIIVQTYASARCGHTP
jgi:hypothetical protein